MLLAALVGAAMLGSASFTTEGCGSVPADVDGAAQDAPAHDVDAGVDGALDSEGPPAQCVCPDAGCFITIDGDGPTQTLRSNGIPPVSYVVLPNAPWSQVYYGQGLAMGGSENPDGGAS